MILIVVGGELILATVASVVWLVVEGGLGVCGCCSVWLTALELVAALRFLAIGIHSLEGKLAEARPEGNQVLVLGAVASLLSFGMMCHCVIELFSLWRQAFPIFTQERVWLLAGSLVFWANSAAVVTAGFLLKNNDRRYRQWRSSLNRPPEDDGYEPEAEA